VKKKYIPELVITVRILSLSIQTRLTAPMDLPRCESATEKGDGSDSEGT
jgi:hypothetical protein